VKKDKGGIGASPGKVGGALLGGDQASSVSALQWHGQGWGVFLPMILRVTLRKGRGGGGVSSRCAGGETEYGRLRVLGRGRQLVSVGGDLKIIPFGRD